MTAPFGSSAAAQITDLLAKVSDWGPGSRLHRMPLESLRAAIEVRTSAEVVTFAPDEALAGRHPRPRTGPDRPVEFAVHPSLLGAGQNRANPP